MGVVIPVRVGPGGGYPYHINKNHQKGPKAKKLKQKRTP